MPEHKPLYTLIWTQTAMHINLYDLICRSNTPCYGLCSGLIESGLIEIVDLTLG